MKKIIRFLTLICVFVSMLSISGSKVEAKTYVDDFDNLYFEATPMITDSKKFNCVITWNTTEKIKFLTVTIELPNNFIQIPYQTGRENCAGTFSVVESGGVYYNTLEFEIYYHQLGNIKATFDYSYNIEFGDNDEHIKSFTYVFITGKWSDERPSSSAIVCGLLISIASAIVTFVVISNSQKTQDEYEDDEIEDVEEIEEVSEEKQDE